MWGPGAKEGDGKGPDILVTQESELEVAGRGESPGVTGMGTR